MNPLEVRMDAPDLRGTIVLLSLTFSLRRDGVHVVGSLEVQPVVPK